MENNIKILNSLTGAQKKEFEKDLQEVYTVCKTSPGFPSGSRNEANVNLNLLDEVYLNVTFDFEDAQTDKVKGRILNIYRYQNKKEYTEAVIRENSSPRKDEWLNRKK